MKQNIGDYSFEYKKKRQWKITKAIIFILAVYVFISLFLNNVMFSVKVNSSSMETDISDGGIVFATPLFRRPSRGDAIYISRMDNMTVPFYERIANSVVRFFTLRKYTPFGDEERMTGASSVRRVIALPGDTLYIKDYVAYVKPKGESQYLTEFELASHPYTISAFSVPVEWDGMGPSGDVPALTLGDNEYYVLADDRVASIDSRMYGTVPYSRIRAKVLFQCFPFGEIRFF